MIAAQLIGIDKSFGRDGTYTPVLRSCSLVVNRGELLVLAGPSGCGKTTLLSILAGTLRPDAGEVHVLDQRIDRCNAAELTEFRGRQVGFVFQQFHLISALSAVENVAVPLLIQRTSRKEALHRASAALAAVKMSGHENARPASLSGGEQQRIAIARALVHEPQLIVCDEPTSALDRQNGQRVMRLLRDIADQAGRTIVVVSHDSRVYEFADRIEEMEDGRIKHLHDSRVAIQTLRQTS